MIKRFKRLVGLLPVAIIFAIVAMKSEHPTTTIVLGLLALVYLFFYVDVLAQIHIANTENIDDIADDLKAIRNLLESKVEQSEKHDEIK